MSTDTTPTEATAAKVRVFCHKCLQQYSVLKKNYPVSKTTRCPECGTRSSFVFDSYQTVDPAMLDHHWITQESEPLRQDARKQAAALLAELTAKRDMKRETERAKESKKIKKGATV